MISRGGVDANRRKIAETGIGLTIALQAHWEVEDKQLAQLVGKGWRVIKTSAKTGGEVETAFTSLAREMAGV